MGQSSPVQTTELAGTMQGLAACLLCSLLSSLAQTQSDSASRPLVDPEQELTILESCGGVADGTRCTKRCIHWTCDPKFARCYQGNCKRAGHHPCHTASPHPCCCGSCDKQMDDPENTECLNNLRKLTRNKKKKKNNRKVKNSG